MDALCCLMIADDFTGACDTGLQLVKAGLRDRVLINGAGDLGGDADVLVWDTETRNCSADQGQGPTGHLRRDWRCGVARAWLSPGVVRQLRDPGCR